MVILHDYQIKDNETQNNMQVNILPLHTSLTSGVGSKGKNIYFFLKVVMLHIKLKRMKGRTLCKQIFCH